MLDYENFSKLNNPDDLLMIDVGGNDDGWFFGGMLTNGTKMQLTMPTEGAPNVEDFCYFVDKEMGEHFLKQFRSSTFGTFINVNQLNKVLYAQNTKYKNRCDVYLQFQNGLIYPYCCPEKNFWIFKLKPRFKRLFNVEFVKIDEDKIKNDWLNDQNVLK